PVFLAQSPLKLEPLNLPSFAILAADEWIGLGLVGHLHGLGVPFQSGPREPGRQATEEHRLGERARVVKGRRRLAIAAAGFDELEIMVGALCAGKLVFLE